MQQALAIAKGKEGSCCSEICLQSTLLRSTRLSTHHTTRSRDGRSPEAGSPGSGRGTGRGTRRASWSTDVDFWLNCLLLDHTPPTRSRQR